jgi:hypothetical protein
MIRRRMRNHFGARHFRMDGIVRAQHFNRIDDVALVESMGDDWHTIGSIKAMHDLPYNSIRNAMLRQVGHRVLECRHTVRVSGMNQRQTVLEYRRTGLPPVPNPKKQPPPRKPQTPQQRVKAHQAALNVGHTPPEQLEVNYNAALMAMEGLESLGVHVVTPRPTPTTEPRTPAEWCRVYLREWKALRKNWQPYTIPAEPVTTTDYEPAPDHPWRATQDRRTA